MDYIHFNEKQPLLEQVPDYHSAAFLLHPFIQMPTGWENNKRRTNPYAHVYPSDEEILALGKPVSWEQVRIACGFGSLKDVAITLATNSLAEKYQRRDLVDKLSNAYPTDFFWPMEDRVSIFLCEGVLKNFSSNGSRSFYFSEPVDDTAGQVNVETCSLATIPELAPAEIMLADDSLQSVFLSQYNLCFTIFLSKEQDIRKLIANFKWEAIVCEAATKSYWFIEEEE